LTGPCSPGDTHLDQSSAKVYLSQCYTHTIFTVHLFYSSEQPNSRLMQMLGLQARLSHNRKGSTKRYKSNQRPAPSQLSLSLFPFIPMPSKTPFRHSSPPGAADRRYLVPKYPQYQVKYTPNKPNCRKEQDTIEDPSQVRVECRCGSGCPV